MKRRRLSLFLLLAACTLPALILLYIASRDDDLIVDNVLGFTRREAKLAERVREVEEQNQLLRRQLSISQTQLMTLMTDTQNNETADGYNDNNDNDNPPRNNCVNKEPEVPKCEVLHVAIVCAGYNSSRSVVTLLKSLLFYRKNPLQLHLVSDSVAQLILQTLFQTWTVPGVEVSFYLADNVQSEVSWIPNKHYSGVYGLMKLTLPKTLPDTLTKITPIFQLSLKPHPETTKTTFPAAEVNVLI